VLLKKSLKHQVQGNKAKLQKNTMSWWQQSRWGNKYKHEQDAEILATK